MASLLRFSTARRTTQEGSGARPELMPQTRIAAQATMQDERLQFARDRVAGQSSARASRVPRPHYIGARNRQPKGREADLSLRRAQASRRRRGGEHEAAGRTARKWRERRDL